jgi:hypothetical protein
MKNSEKEGNNVSSGQTQRKKVGIKSDDKKEPKIPVKKIENTNKQTKKDDNFKPINNEEIEVEEIEVTKNTTKVQKIEEELVSPIEDDEINSVLNALLSISEEDEEDVDEIEDIPEDEIEDSLLMDSKTKTN